MENLLELKEVLERRINDSNKIFLIPHIYVDFDALASCIGMYEIVKRFKKPVYIIFNDDLNTIDMGVKSIINELSTNVFFVDLLTYNKIKTNSDLLITLDVNKEDLIYSKNIINNFNKDYIIVIDHHNEGENTIDTNLKYIDIKSSSASEIVTLLLKMYNIKYDRTIANYLLAGIYLDTAKFQNIREYETANVIANLIKNGANLEKVKEYFISDYISDRKVHELINKANFITKNIAICVDQDNIIYTRAELAKVAEYLLRFKMDATFAAGFIDNELISISARSGGKIDVCEIMEKLGGGGTTYSAATKIESGNLEENVKKLEYIIKDKIREL